MGKVPIGHVVMKAINAETKSPHVFETYGRYYDVLYSDKDYEKECDLLEEIFRRHSKRMPKTILDAGCGTGGHAILLTRRGYEVTGIDASETMINIGRDKARKTGLNTRFEVMDLRRLQLSKKFDACICMFAVIDYLTSEEDLSRTLTNIRHHLRKDCLFVFDFWYGPAVLKIGPSSRMKTVEKDELKVARFSEPNLDTLRNICQITLRLIVMKRNSIVYNGTEKHTVRYYFPEEIKHHLKKHRFNVVRLSAFPDLNVPPSEETWNVIAIARAI